MKLESLVIAGQQYSGEYVIEPCTHRPSHQGSGFYPKILYLQDLRLKSWPGWSRNKVVVLEGAAGFLLEKKK